MKGHNKTEITLRDMLRVVFRHKFVIMITFIVIMVSVYIGIELRTPLYEASVKILVSGQMQKDVEYQRGLGVGSLTGTQMALVTSKPIMERTVKALELHKRPLDYEKKYATKLKKILIDHNARQLNEYLEGLSAEQKESYILQNAIANLSANTLTFPHGDTSIFIITVKDYSPFSAARIANALSRSFVMFDIVTQIAELQLTYGGKNATIMKLENYLDKLEESLDGRLLPDIEAIGPASVKIIAQAGMGRILIMRPSKPAALIIGFIFSIVIGLLLAYGFDRLNPTLRSPQEVETFLNIRLLGTIPKKGSKGNPLIGHSNPSAKYIESFQSISEHIYSLMRDKHFKTLLISDIEGSEATAVTLANIGICFAKKTGNRVLIIDSNLRNPLISKVFNIADDTGLLGILDGKVEFEDVVQEVDSNLFVLSTEKISFDPIFLLESKRMSDLINKVKEEYDLVLINSASLKNSSDTVLLPSLVDTTALLISEGKVRKIIIESAVAPLKQKKVHILGAIINDRTYVIPKIIYDLT